MIPPETRVQIRRYFYAEHFLAWRSPSGSPLSHSRTGSRQVSVRKKINVTFRGSGSSAILRLNPYVP